MATADEVEATLERLMERFQHLGEPYRSMLPSRRMVEAVFDDIDRIYHASWRRDELSELMHGPADDPDIRVSLSSDDLMKMAGGELRFRKAYASNRVRIEATMTDLLRLRSALP